LLERASPGPVIDGYFNPTARALMGLRMPTIAAVNGVAAGAGASLAMACDMTIAAPGASFVQAFSKIGLIPDAGGSWLLVERLGLARAMGLALTGDKLMAPQAKDWGLIWDVADDPLAAAEALAQRLAAMPTEALVATRRLLRDAGTRRAFRQKRPAQFKGE
jgi:2-(1,2-epoxy-1,2-dihydrophenyl)acetyl-CoA isomerase